MWCCRMGGTSSRRPCSEMTPGGRKEEETRSEEAGGQPLLLLVKRAKWGSPRLEGCRVPSPWSNGHPHTGCAHSSAHAQLTWHTFPSEFYPDSLIRSPNSTCPKKPLGPQWPLLTAGCPVPRAAFQVQSRINVSPGVRHMPCSPDYKHSASRLRPPKTGSLPSGLISWFLFPWKGHSY